MTTIGEAAVNYGNQITLKSTDNIGARHIAWRSFEAGAEFAQRWIPVEEELPEINKYGFSESVLTKLNETVIVQKGYTNKRNRFIWCDKQPTHWRPIERI